MRQPLLTIKALRLQSSIPEHLGYLSVLLTIFSENEFTFIIVVLVLSSSAILSSLLLIVVRLYSMGHESDEKESYLSFILKIGSW